MQIIRRTTWSVAVAATLAGATLLPTTGAQASVPAARPSSLTTSTDSGALDGVDASAVLPESAWGTCASSRLQAAGAQCTMLSVPLDYDKPGGAKIQLALSRIKHTVPDAKYQGIMLVNPGGPGGSGLGLSVLGSFVPNGAGDAYDWIGFDPRGVGSSVPALTCDPNYFAGPRPEYVPTTRAIEKTWLAKAKGYAQACGAAGGALLDHLKTIDSVRDMDRIRAALGRRQINYYGFSYGTYLGTVYSTVYPQRVRRMVLDGVVDPTRVWYQANLDQDIAFDRNIKIWWAWVAKYDSVYHLGATEAAVEKNWYAEQARLGKAPAGGVVGSSEWTDTFLFAGYYQSTWLGLAQTWVDWVTTRNPAPLIDAYNGTNGVGDDNGYAIYDAVQCTDVQWPQEFSTWREDNSRVYRKAPFETWGNAWYNAPCLSWPAQAGEPVEVDGEKAPPILLISETLDAATPYSGALRVRKLFPKSSLLALPGGTSHANSLSANACEDDQIAAYLADGTLPPRKPGGGADTTCAPLPVPDPTAAAAVAATTSGAGSQRFGLLGRVVHPRGVAG